jgi:hypothetical protein
LKKETVSCLFLKPFIAGNANLPDNPGNKINTDLLAVRIGNGENERSFDHVRMFAALERTFKPECLKLADKFRP